MKNSKWVKRMKETFPFALFLSFTFGFFGPIQLYITNVNEYWFSIWDILWPCALCTVVAFAVILCIGALLPLKGRKIYFGLLFGLALALYIQGNFINTDYGVLDGTAINWDEYADVAIWNTALWVALIIIPVALMIFKTKISYKITKWVSVYIVAIQVLTLGFLAITTDLEKDNNYYLSTEGIYDISTKKNVIVFLLDSFDDNYLKEILKNEPQFLEQLDGFTYFDNSTGMYPTTKGSLPYILTGNLYRNETPFREYIKESWDNSKQYKDLKEANFDIGIYTDPLFVDMQNRLDIINNIEKSEIKVSSKSGLTKMIYKLTSFQYFPHMLKQYVWFYSGDFNLYKTSIATAAPVFSLDNVTYYNKLMSTGLQISEENNIFRFIHLNGAHPPYTINENVETMTDGSATYMTAAKGSLKMVYKYIEQLKNLGVYNNTVMVIMADHGLWTGSPTNPVLLVKQQNENGTLKIVDAPVSHSDFWGIIMSAIDLNKENQYGYSLDSIIQMKDRKRGYLFYSWDDTWFSEYLPPMREYDIDANSNDITSFHLLDAKKYSIGDELFFSHPGNANEYAVWGISSCENTHTWTSGKKVNMAFELTKKPEKNLRVLMNVKYVFNGRQNINIYANNVLCHSEEISGDEISFTIPKELIQDNKYLELYFELPDAISPTELGQSSDARVLALAFSSMIIEEVE